MDLNPVFRRLSDDDISRFSPFAMRWVKWLGAVVAGAVALKVVML
jgi:hypothetical protein